MKHSLRVNLFLTVSLMILVTFSSCRKKDSRYEGHYVGTERNTYQDSGATELSVDTTYVQEIEVTYDKKIYTFLKQLNPPNQVFSVSKKEFEDHKYRGWNSNGYLKFSGDSMYLYSDSFTDVYDNWDTETWYFTGKRN